MNAPISSEEKRIEVTGSERGHAHTKLYGVCTANVTVDDIKAKFYHPYFGGRDAWVHDRQWGVIRHDD